MNWFIYFFGSGIAFFVGVCMILAGVAIFVRWQRQWLKVVATLLAMIGMILIAMTAVPLPYWLYGVAGVVTWFWLIAERFPRGWLLRRRTALRMVVVAVWICALIMELPYHVWTNVCATGNPTFYIIGDSVTAGIAGQDGITWPRMLAKARPVHVVDFSRSGATARSALRQSNSLPPAGGLVLLEIGGNDMFGVGTTEEFERDLDQLLSKVCKPGREVIMFELPLPPFYNEFGTVQRRLASRYGVALIPRRLFVAVLTTDGNTVDSVHLSSAGHKRMAEVVWDLIGSAYR